MMPREFVRVLVNLAVIRSGVSVTEVIVEYLEAHDIAMKLEGIKAGLEAAAKFMDSTDILGKASEISIGGLYGAKLRNIDPTSVLWEKEKTNGQN